MCDIVCTEVTCIMYLQGKKLIISLIKAHIKSDGKVFRIHCCIFDIDGLSVNCLLSCFYV